LYVDYGSQVHIGARSSTNMGLMALDVAEITIGDDVQIGRLTPRHVVARPSQPSKRYRPTGQPEEPESPGART